MRRERPIISQHFNGNSLRYKTNISTVYSKWHLHVTYHLPVMSAVRNITCEYNMTPAYSMTSECILTLACKLTPVLMWHLHLVWHLPAIWHLPVMRYLIRHLASCCKWKVFRWMLSCLVMTWFDLYRKLGNISMLSVYLHACSTKHSEATTYILIYCISLGRVSPR